jgi:(p)ppGpp synthase/HD superfamily hydrolase
MKKHTIEKVIEFAKKHYDEKTFEHALRVADRVEGTDKIVAILHDIVEDTDVTVDDIRYEFDYDGDLADEVAYITRRKGLTYAEYIRDIAGLGSDITIRVKLADLHDHLYGAPTDPPGDLGLRYVKAVIYLEKAIAYRKECGDYFEAEVA